LIGGSYSEATISVDSKNNMSLSRHADPCVLLLICRVYFSCCGIMASPQEAACAPRSSTCGLNNVQRHRLVKGTSSRVLSCLCPHEAGKIYSAYLPISRVVFLLLKYFRQTSASGNCLAVKIKYLHGAGGSSLGATMKYRSQCFNACLEYYSNIIKIIEKTKITSPSFSPRSSTTTTRAAELLTGFLAQPPSPCASKYLSEICVTGLPESQFVCCVCF
jgi:hypothetical protein